MELETAAILACESVAILHPDGKSDLLKQIAELAAARFTDVPIQAETIQRALAAREAVGSTGFGAGIAIPHCRLEAASKLVLGLACIPTGVDFDALDGAPVYLAPFIVGPPNPPTIHIRLLSQLSQALDDEAIRNQLRPCDDAESARRCLLAALPKSISCRDDRSKRLCTVVTRKEKYVQPILQALAGLSPSRLPIVIEVQSAIPYLARLPLFAGMWDQTRSNSARTIVAVIECGLTNEAIRRIDQVCGPRHEAEVLLTIQHLDYVSGGLES